VAAVSKFQQFFKKQISIEVAISLALGIIILYWMFNRYALEFFTAVFAMLAAAVIMLIYLAIAWHRLSSNSRYSIGLSIVGWLFMAYAVIHANGLTLSAMFRS
jgi:Na+/glutamate symporter